MFLIINKWVNVYVGLFFSFRKLSWFTGKILTLVVFLFMVIVLLFVYGISYYFGKLLKGRVVPIFARKG